MKYLPRGYTLHDAVTKTGSIVISNENGKAYSVSVEELCDQLAFTQGWRGLVDGEGITNGDIGYFKRTGEEEFKIVVHNIHGVQKQLFPHPSPIQLHNKGW